MGNDQLCYIQHQVVDDVVPLMVLDVKLSKGKEYLDDRKEVEGFEVDLEVAKVVH